MTGLRMRILSAGVLAACVAVLAGDLPGIAAEKKAGRKTIADATKKTDGTLAGAAKLNAEQLARHIDALVEKRLLADKVEPSAVCSDEEFLRRVTLDLTGKIPTADKAVAFLESKEPNKRARLIDDLLASKDYGKYMADVWQAMLLPRDSDNRRLIQWYPNLTTWLEKQFNDNPGWDKTVKEFMAASGDVEKNGPVIYWLANNSADKMTDNVTRMFLGVQLQCAQCHNHPFTDYKQEEYWHMAAFFMKVAPDGNPKAAAKKGGTIAVGESGRANKKRLGPDAKILPPKFLQAESPSVRPADPLRPVLAEWMTKKSNPFFNKAMANRVWGHLFGRGLVNPVDDMHDSNPATHPELLADLAGQFTANDFDVKYLFRAVCNTRAYQRSSKSNGAEPPPELFARMAVKPLTPGQLYDSVQQLVGAGGGERPRERAKQAARGQNPRQQFIASYGIEDGADPTEYQAGIPQVLRLMNAGQYNSPALAMSLSRGSKSDAEVIEKLYLTVLSRRPTAEETDRVNKYLTQSSENGRDRKMGGVLWALMNSSEFALNR